MERLLWTHRRFEIAFLAFAVSIACLPQALAQERQREFLRMLSRPMCVQSSDELVRAQLLSSVVVIESSDESAKPMLGVLLSKDGLLVTCNNIEIHNRQPRVKLPSGNSYPARVVTNAGRLAVLKAELSDDELGPLQQSAANPGELILVLGQDAVIRQGAVAAVRRTFTGKDGKEYNSVIQTDVRCPPGSFLFNRAFQLLGVVIDSDDKGSGMSFAISLRDVASIVP